PLAALSTLKFANVAMPLAAPTTVVPESVPDPGLAASDMVTVLPELVTRLPPASCTSTSIAGASATPPLPLDGPTWKPSFAAEPTVTVNALEVAPVSPDALASSVYPVPALSMLIPVNVATPLTAATVLVPDNVPGWASARIAGVTLFVHPATGFPPMPWISPRTAGEIAVPPAVADGWRKNPSLVAEPTEMSNAGDVAEVSPAAEATRV